MKYQIQFDEAAHKYTVDGIVRASVTTILKEFGLYPAYDPDPRYMDRGTAVHALTELHDKGTLALEAWRQMDDAQTDPFWRLSPYYDAYVQFLSDFRPAWTHIESLLFSPALNVCGTMDRAGIINARQCVLDIKATDSDLAKCTGLQLAGYAMMLDPVNFREYDRIGLPLTSKGAYRKPVYYDDPNDFDVFISAARLYHWKKGMNL